MRAGIALGSNLGDRLGNLLLARRRLLALHDGSGPFLCSKIYETAPVDCPPGSLPFLNAAIELSSQSPPLDLLTELQRIEIESGRPAEHPFHSPRTLDLDFLYYGSLQLSHNTLTLPHKRFPSRLFVLKPLADICPDLVLPTTSHSIRELCEREELHPSNPQDTKFISFF